MNVSDRNAGAAAVAIGKGTRVFTAFIERIAAGGGSSEPADDGDGVSQLSEAFVRTLTVDGGAGAALVRARDSIAQAMCGKRAEGTLGELKCALFPLQHSLFDVAGYIQCCHAVSASGCVSFVWETS